MLSQSSSARKRSSQILKMSYPTMSWRVVPANFHLVNKCPRDILHEKVVGVPTSQVDFEDESERAGHEDLVLIQLGHRNIQGLAWSCLASIKGYELNRVLGLHGSERFFLRVPDAKFLAQPSCIDHQSKQYFAMAEGGFRQPNY